MGRHISVQFKCKPGLCVLTSTGARVRDCRGQWGSRQGGQTSEKAPQLTLEIDAQAPREEDMAMGNVA